jgi:hypothetical protein
MALKQLTSNPLQKARIQQAAAIYFFKNKLTNGHGCNKCLILGQ